MSLNGTSSLLMSLLLYGLASAGAITAVTESEMTVGVRTLLLGIAFAAGGIVMFWQRRDLLALKEEARAVRTHYNKWRSNYMTILVSAQMLSHVVMEVAKDQATRYRIQEIQDEVKRQIDELEKERQVEGDPPFIRVK